jgi:hypothetical protein
VHLLALSVQLCTGSSWSYLPTAIYSRLSNKHAIAQIQQIQ